MSSILAPPAWRDGFPSTLEVLGFVRDQILKGVGIEVFIGSIDTDRFSTFVDGIHFYQYCCGRSDDSYIEFIAWLRDVKGEFPSPGGWAKSLLAKANGDHRVAIMKFLDRGTEFVSKSQLELE
jgi:hypothetical protein